MKISIFHNAGDFSYLYGLVNGLSKIANLSIDVIDSEQSINHFKDFKGVSVYNFIPPYKNTLNPFYRLYRILNPYIKNIIYASKTDSRIFHIQWFNRINWIDKIILVNIYRLMNKRVIYTAHNVNTLARNNKDNLFNRITLKYFYKKVDYIIVHNNKSKKELIENFFIDEDKISVIKFGLNIFNPQKGITKDEAKRKLNLPLDKKIIMFFGAINIYKGIEILLDAYEEILKESDNYHLIIAGENRNDEYFQKIKNIISQKFDNNAITVNFNYIDDHDVEYYFASSDCLVLPYKSISQSGLHFLSYSFGLPVIATDVGSFKDEDIIEGKTGFICKPNDSRDLKNTIYKYFESDLYKNISINKIKIKNWAEQTYNWDEIAKTTYDCYLKLYNEGL